MGFPLSKACERTWRSAKPPWKLWARSVHFAQICIDTSGGLRKAIRVGGGEIKSLSVSNEENKAGVGEKFNCASARVKFSAWDSLLSGARSGEKGMAVSPLSVNEGREEGTPTHNLCRQVG